MIGICIGVIGLIALGVYFATRQSADKSSVQFTNMVTGKQSFDIVGEEPGQEPGVIDSASATIDGINIIYDYLTNEQAVNAQAAISDFLLARSGLTSVHAAVVQNSFLHTDNTTQIDISVVRPQATYRITITAVNEVQSTPDVSFKRVGN